jgi:hypothetical protein
MLWIGLQREASMVKLARVRRLGKKVSIELLRTLPLSEEEHVKQFYTAEGSYVSGLDISEILIREIELKIKDKKKILKLLPFQIEPHLPYSPEDAVICTQILPQKLGSRVALFSTKSSSLSHHIQSWFEYGITPYEVSCTPVALLRFVNHFYPSIEKGLVFHIGANASTAAYFKENRILFCQSFSLGSSVFKEEDSLFMEKELSRLFSFLEKKIGDAEKNTDEVEPIKVLITGNFSSAPKCKELLISNFPSSMRLEEDSMIPNSSYDVTTLNAYAVPIGLALDASSYDGRSVQFRKGPFLAKITEKKRIKAFLSFAIGAIALTLTTISLEAIHTHLKKKEFSGIMQKDFSYFLSQTENSSLETLDEIEFEIDSLETSFQKKNTPYPLTPSFPNITEVLAFLSSYPNPSIDIKKVAFSLIKHPQITSPNTPYVGKISLEVNINKPEEALAFQKALKQNSSLVDTKKEFFIENTGTSYFISFFLKHSFEGTL